MKIINNSSFFTIMKSGNRDIIPDNYNNKSIKSKRTKKIQNSKINIISNKKGINKGIKSNVKKTKNISNLPTQMILKIQDENEQKKNLKNFTLINMDLNLSRNKIYIPPNSLIILNNYTFEEAVKYDKR